MKTTTATPRPKRSDPAISLLAAKELAPAVLAWLADHETTLADVVDDLVTALRYEDDGYEIAKDLEDYCSYSPDAALVEILDGAGWAKRKALTEAETEWVLANNIQPIPEKATVRWLEKKDAGVGVVTNNHTDGKSTVAFASLGHVTEAGRTGCHGFIVEWEELEVVP